MHVLALALVILGDKTQLELNCIASPKVAKGSTATAAIAGIYATIDVEVVLREVLIPKNLLKKRDRYWND